MKKTLKRVMIGLLAAVILLAAGLGWMFRKEIQTLNSIQKVDDYGMYQIEYSADYGLDQLVASGGASSDSELVSYRILDAVRSRRRMRKGIGCLAGITI